MAFPTVTTVIDDFARANVAPITGGPGWTNPFGFPTSGMVGMDIISSAAAEHPGSTCGSATVPSYGPDVEAYYTIPSGAATPVNSGFYIWARCQNPGTDTFCAYGVWYNRYGTGERELSLIRDDNGSDTGLRTLPLDSVILADGDAIGLSCVGNTITGYYRLSGAWSTIGAPITDTTYPAAGPIAVFFEGNAGSVRITPLQGGTIVPAQPMVIQPRQPRSHFGPF